MSAPAALRAGRDDDAQGFIALISACWAEYPGCVFDLDGEVPELRALASHYAARGGALWVAEADGAVAGMVAAAPSGAGAWELHKLYVARPRRGDGTAAALLAAAERHALAQGAMRLTLWSDTRFDRAHRFYEKHDYVRAGAIRSLDDRSHSIEFGYAKPACGVERLDAAASASASGSLARLLVACVDGGASVSFLPPLGRDVAVAFFRETARAVATGRCVLLAAWTGARLAGTVQLDLATPPNQPHRAELKKLLVEPQARRGGIATALVRAAEAAAAQHGRTLLTLDTVAGGAGDALYRSLGWRECGRIPDFALNAAGGYDATVIFCKRLDPAKTNASN